MRFISCYCCCCAGKVDISRQGQIFTRRCKETTALSSWRCELLWQFSCELWKNEGFDMSSEKMRVLMWARMRGKLLLSNKMRGSQFWCLVRNDSRSSPTDSTRSFLLTTIFLLIFLVRITKKILLWFLFISPQDPLRLNLGEHFPCLPFYPDIWQVFSHLVAFPEEKWRCTTTFLLW